jgi:hypothetical protein
MRLSVQEGEFFQMVQVQHHNKIEAATEDASLFAQKCRTIAVETIDYSKKSFADNAAFLKKLSGAKSIGDAFQIQSDFVKESYEAYLAQVKKAGSLYSDLGIETFKPMTEVAANALKMS